MLVILNRLTPVRSKDESDKPFTGDGLDSLLRRFLALPTDFLFLGTVQANNQHSTSTDH
jgi:hypothetical protein